MTLPIKKIYIDTKYKSAGSISNSDFKIDLPQTLTFPENSVFYIDDVSIPHSWYVIEEGVNDRLFIQIMSDSGAYIVFYVIPIPAGNYNGVDLAAELKIRLNNVVELPTFTNVYTTSYSIRKNTISINLNQAGYKWKIFSSEELRTSSVHNSYSNGYDINNPQEMNEIIGDVSGYYATPFGYESENLNLQSIRNIYIHSSLGNYNTIGPKGESSIVKKVPVNADKGGYIFDQVLVSNDFGDCSKQTVRSIKFDLKDSNGRHINFRGAHLSFSIIFSRLDASL